MSLDRFNIRKAGSGTLACSAQQGSGQFVVPGTNFVISRALLRITLTAQQASLAATDGLQITNVIEGPMLRELIGDVTSLQLLVRCSSPIKFGVSLSDSANAYSLVKLATISSANAFTLIQFPNLPLWTGSGTFPLTPGNVGYNLRICLCTGTTNMAAANDIWAAGNLYGAVGQDSFNTFPVNTTFDLIFVQHQSGPLCETMIDCPFVDNYDACLRYYAKSYPYSTAIGTASAVGHVPFFVIQTGVASARAYVPFCKKMAQVPNVTIYNPLTGAINSVQDNNSVNWTVSSVSRSVDCIDAIAMTSNFTTQVFAYAHYVADTGW
jgi:hypothetical protein